MSLLALDDARARLLDIVRPGGAETVPLAQALGRTLADPLIAQRTQPPAPVSAMDGWAVRAADLTGGPVTLRIVGQAAAGEPLDQPLSPGEAARIFTGGVLPPGADQVVIQENARAEAALLHLTDPPQPGRHVRAAGRDFTQGQSLLSPGTVLTAQTLALAASAGALWPKVAQPPEVAVLCTGDELVEPGETPGPGGIVNALGVGLGARIAAAGGRAVYLGVVRDDLEAMTAAFDRSKRSTLVVCVGGASVGERDFARAGFAAAGGELAFAKINLKPGKPTWGGGLGGSAVLGLPGNPASAFVAAELLLAPLIAKALGRPGPHAPDLSAGVLATPLPANGDREAWVRAKTVGRDDFGRPILDATADQDSSLLTVLAGSDALIRRAAGADAAAAGDAVAALMLTP
ncbi:MAG: molybdopterin molybdotransferase MoeA [Maricaulaceae bacterium]